MILGFTGTRQGLTPAQRAALPGVLATLPERVLHGGAVGADEEFHDWLRALAPPRGVPIPKQFLDAMIHCDVYPILLRERFWRDRWVDRHDMAFKTMTLHGPFADPLARNRIIAERCDALLACPAEPDEQLRSGTWSTIRYARKAGKPITIIRPDGGVLSLSFEK